MDFISQLYAIVEGEKSGGIIKVDDTFKRQKRVVDGDTWGE